MDVDQAKPAMLSRAAASRGVVRAGPPGSSIPMERMEAMVSIAGSVLEAVQDEYRLAAKAADLAAGVAVGAEADDPQVGPAEEQTAADLR